ncbi:MAG: hypothetical protein KIPDCIKN_03443 [Haliscomenobacter sp.]|nr:hypothetical protein [Haliscomenobacter sp.]
MLRATLAFITICASSCMNKAASDIDVLEKNLNTALPFEMQRLLSQEYSQKSDMTVPSDSTLIYLLSGASYKAKWHSELLQEKLQFQKETFQELDVSHDRYIQITDSICSAKNIRFLTPKDMGEVDEKTREGKVFAYLQMHRILINKNRNRCAYLSISAIQIDRHLQPGNSSVILFRKKKSIWVFEKEL